MSAKVKSYQSVIKALQERLYPSMLDNLRKMKETADKEDLEIFSTLHLGFKSITTYETRLVFPAILSLFSAASTGENHFSPNVKEIYSLMKSKEEHLEEIIELLPDMDDIYNPGLQSTLKTFLQLYRTAYLPQKQSWYSLLQDLFDPAGDPPQPRFSRFLPKENTDTGTDFQTPDDNSGNQAIY